MHAHTHTHTYPFTSTIAYTRARKAHCGEITIRYSNDCHALQGTGRVGCRFDIACMHLYMCAGIHKCDHCQTTCMETCMRVRTYVRNLYHNYLLLSRYVCAHCVHSTHNVWFVSACVRAYPYTLRRFRITHLFALRVDQQAEREPVYMRELLLQD